MTAGASPFTRIVPGPKRLIVASWGLSKEGKSHNALTWPQPLYYLNFDQGIEELLSNPEFADLEIYQPLDKDTGKSSLYVPSENNPELAKKILREFDKAYEWALGQQEGTVVIDTATQLNQLAQDVYLDPVAKKRQRAAERQGKDDWQLYPYDYGDANRYMRGMYLKASQYPRMNVLFIHRAREKYDGSGKPMGIFQPQSFTEMASLVQMVWNIKLVREGEGSSAVIKSVGTLEKSRWSLDYIGMQFDNPTYEDFVRATGRGG